MLTTIAGSVTGESGMMPKVDYESEIDAVTAGLDARLFYPSGIVLDENNDNDNFDLYVADQKNQRLLRLRRTNDDITNDNDSFIVSTIMGNQHDLDKDGLPVRSKPKGNDGCRSEECDLFNHPAQLLIRNTTATCKMLYFFDKDNHRLCRLTGEQTNGTSSTSKWDGFITITGGVEGERGFTDGTCADTAKYRNPMGMAMEVSANGKDLTFYVADISNHAVRIIQFTEDGTSIQNFQSKTLVGGQNDEGEAVTGCADGPCEGAKLQFPLGVALDRHSKLLYVTDFGNNRVVQIDLETSILSTLAGSPTGEAGCSDTLLSMPTAVACDSKGNIYVTDMLNHRVCQVNVDDDNTVTTIAGSPTGERGCTDGENALLNEPGAIIVTPDGNTLYVVDTGNNRICKIDVSHLNK